jgi:hypothetical protein
MSLEGVDDVAVPETTSAAAVVLKHLEAVGGGDLLAGMIKAFADALMSAEVDAPVRRQLRRSEPERVNAQRLPGAGLRHPGPAP